MNSKTASILAMSLLIAFVGICALVADWGIRQEMVYYKNWKETYDSRYCPTCGQPLNIENGIKTKSEE